jgi:DGQHR domain-containing protein
MDRVTVNALVTPQWRKTWDDIQWDPSVANAKPDKAFLTFVMKASELRQLSGVFRRSPKAEVRRSEEDNIQRPHEAGRSREIRRFVEYGYPMSSMTPSQLKNTKDNVQRPGWLPTAVVVNILVPGESREGLAPLSPANALDVPDLKYREGGDVVVIGFPAEPVRPDAGETPPLEVIDGQHRLWAFEDEEHTDDYFLPVVAFVNLSKMHQAYLFWSINIKPKRINTSLAFDLYPVLRSQEWLMQGEGVKIYRESRAQELTEALWATPSSPWYDRINMIGTTGVADSKPVSQASFVRSLLASFVKPWKAPRNIAGGLFGTDDEGGLDWNRSQQAAFLVAAWQELIGAIKAQKPSWIEKLGSVDGASGDPLGRHSILGSDQGVRVFLLILNELSFRLRDEARLRAWQMLPAGESIDPRQVEEALEDFREAGLQQFVADIARPLASFDWRGTKAPGTTDEEARRKSAYRGSGGYVALRKDLYQLLADGPDSPISREARVILDELDETEKGKLSV